MNGKRFIDTNIWVYANDTADRSRQEKAREVILNAIRSDRAVVSTQVLSEFYVTVTQKIQVKLSPETAKREILLIRSIDIVDIDYPSVLNAIQISNRHQLSYWDSLIVASALKAGCSAICTEDMNHDQVVEGIQICNPFL